MTNRINGPRANPGVPVAQGAAGGEIVAPGGAGAAGDGFTALPYMAPDLRGLAVPVADLTPSPTNARRHRVDRDVPVLMASLERFGQRKPIVVRAGTGEVIAGNGTLQAAIALGWSHVAVSWFHGTDDEALAYALVDNRSAELSEWDLETLSSQLRTLHEADPEAPGRLGWDEASLGPLLAAVWTPAAQEPLPTRDETGTPEPMTEIALTASQHTVVREAMDRVREQEGDAELTDGRCLELIAADFLGGA